jgi:predicted nucleic acid-binding protein
VIHLLDVNVLLALGYTAHVHNDRAETWLQHLQTHNASVAWLPSHIGAVLVCLHPHR